LTLTESNLDGLIKLLDDSGAGIDQLIDRVGNLPEADLSRLLERARAASQTVRENIYSALNRNLFSRLEGDWRRVACTVRPNLEAALTLIGRTKPEAAELPVSASLDQLAAEVGSALSGDRAFDNGLAALGKVLSARGFRGNAADYYDPSNSYLQRVLATGLGIPISLCCVAILVGQRLELPVHGIGTPGHFLGFYGDPFVRLGSFFDPYAGFKRVTLGEIQALIGQYAAGPVDAKTLRPSSEREILSRTLGNLVGCYTARGETERARGLAKWQALLDGS